MALNGTVLTTPAVKVRPGDILTVDGKMIDEPEPTRIFRYHKPTGLLTSHNDPKNRPTVFQALPRDLPRVISVGRLDLNSEGLLLLTNDGELSRALEMPQNAWAAPLPGPRVRRHHPGQAGPAEGRHAPSRACATVSIEARLDKAQEKAGGGKNIWITLSLSEGKNREVRKVLEAIGLKVNRLIRLSYGPFALGTLLPGQVEEVGPRVIRELLEGIIPPENMPQGDKPRFVGVAEPLKALGQAGGGDVQRRGVPRTGRMTQVGILLPEEKVEEEKFVRKAGWAKPKKKPVIVSKSGGKAAPAKASSGKTRPRQAGRGRGQEVDREQDRRPPRPVAPRGRRQAHPRKGPGREGRRQARQGRPGEDGRQAEARRAAGQRLQATGRRRGQAGRRKAGVQAQRDQGRASSGRQAQRSASRRQALTLFTRPSRRKPGPKTALAILTRRFARTFSLGPGFRRDERSFWGLPANRSPGFPSA